MPLERIASFTYLHEAELARALLESAGIEAHVADRHLVGLDWQMASALGGVKLLVASEDASAAREVLAAPPEALDTEEAPAALDPAAACPKCGAEGTPANRLDRRVRAFSMLTGALPLTIGRYRLACPACGTRWRAVPPHRGLLRVLADVAALSVLALTWLPGRLLPVLRPLLSRDTFACWRCGAEFASGAASCPACGIPLPGRVAYAQRVRPGHTYDGACASCHLPFAHSEYAPGADPRCASCGAALPLPR